MAQHLMEQFKAAANKAFSNNQVSFSIFGRSFEIVHMHGKEFAVCHDGIEIVRIFGNIHSFTIAEV